MAEAINNQEYVMRIDDRTACTFPCGFAVLVKTSEDAFELQEAVKGFKVNRNNIEEQLSQLIQRLGFGEVIQALDMEVPLEPVALSAS